MKDKCHDSDTGTSTIAVTSLPSQELTVVKPFWFISQMKSQRNSLFLKEEYQSDPCMCTYLLVSL